MKNRKLITARSIQIVSILSAFIFAPSALADCVPSISDDGRESKATILAIDANNGCADIQGQEGCTIGSRDLAGGTCTYESGGKSFTVESGFNPDGSLSWKLISGNITGIDTAIVGGGSRGKNNCGYVYDSDVASGSGGDCKALNNDGSCAVFQNITSLHVCTDGKDDIAPAPPQVAEPLPSCDLKGALDSTGIECPTYTEDECGAAIAAAVERNEVFDCIPGTTHRPVVVCNLEKDKPDWGTTDGSDVCCQCGIPEEKQTACVVTEEEIPGVNECTQSMTVNPTQSVELMFFKDDVDPCTWLKTRKGWVQYCY